MSCYLVCLLRLVCMWLGLAWLLLMRFGFWLGCYAQAVRLVGLLSLLVVDCGGRWIVLWLLVLVTFGWCL